MRVALRHSAIKRLERSAVIVLVAARLGNRDRVRIKPQLAPSRHHPARGSVQVVREEHQPSPGQIVAVSQWR